jgi:hypothetical protein
MFLIRPRRWLSLPAALAVPLSGYIAEIGAAILTLQSDRSEPLVIPYDRIASIEKSQVSLGGTFLALPSVLVGTLVLLIILFPPAFCRGG